MSIQSIHSIDEISISALLSAVESDSDERKYLFDRIIPVIIDRGESEMFVAEIIGLINFHNNLDNESRLTLEDPYIKSILEKCAIKTELLMLS